MDRRAMTLLAALLGSFFITVSPSNAAPAATIEQLPTGQVRLSWPGSEIGWEVEETSALGSGAAWRALTNSVLNGGEFELLVEPTAAARFYRLAQRLPPIFVASSSPSQGETGVSPWRETILYLSEPLPGAMVMGPNDLYAEFGDRRILSRAEISSDRQVLTLFYLENLPPNAEVIVTLTGNETVRRQLLSFRTSSTSALDNTAVVGRVFASEARGDGSNVPLQNVIVTVDGAEETLRAVTDANGFFRLQPAPAGRFFVHVDGRTANGSQWPGGAYYPFVGKAWVGIAGATNTSAGGSGEIYLPLIQPDALKAVSATEATVVTASPSVTATNPIFAQVSVTVPANSLFSESGARGGRVGLAPVPPDRLPEPLPPGLNLPVVITIQTDGPQNFDRPAPVRFPNLPDPVTGVKLGPGAKSVLWSFNHDTGRWEPQGTGTVTADGNFIESDPGVGVRQPGWHGFGPGGPGGGPGPGPSPNRGDDCGDDDCDNDGIPNDEEDDQCDKDLYLLIGSIFDCANGLLGSASGVDPGSGCIMGAGNSAVAASRDCQIDPAGCNGAIANALVGTGIGCAEWIIVAGVGKVNPYVKAFLTAAGLFHGCVLGPGQNYGNYKNCKTAAGQGVLARQAAPSLTAIAQDNPFEAQAIFAARARAYFKALFGTDEWMANPESSSEMANTFFRQLADAVFQNSPGGLSVTPEELAALLALPRPTGVTPSEAEQTVRRYERLATGNLQPGDINPAELETAASQFVDVLQVFQAQGWNYHGAFRAGLLQVAADFQNLCRAQSPPPAGSIGGGGGSSGGGGGGGGGGAVGGASGGVPTPPRTLKFALKNFDTGFIQRGEVQAWADLPQFILAPDSFYGMYYLDPETREIAACWFVSKPVGQFTEFPCPLWIDPADAAMTDLDSDGVNDVAELILGSNATNSDSDGDGLSDFAELSQGMSPISSEVRPIGPVASAASPGNALEVWAQGNYAFVADGARGLAVFALNGFESPVLVAQRDTPGSASAISGENGYVAIADGVSGLAIFDVRSPETPVLVRQVGALGNVQMVFVHLGSVYAASPTNLMVFNVLTGELTQQLPMTRPEAMAAHEGRFYVLTSTELITLNPTDDILSVGSRVAVPGSAAPLEFGRKLAIAGGIAYVGAFQGFRRVDISDPANLRLLPVPSGTTAALHDIDATGSGLLATVTSFSGQGTLNVSLHRIPTTGGEPEFLLSFDTPGAPRSLVVHNGAALVADGVGLVVANILPPDSGAAVPAVAMLPHTIGNAGRVEELSLAGITARASDDVHVRSVQLFVDDALVGEDGSHPFHFAYLVPQMSASKTNIVARLRAWDMAGGSRWSDPVTLSLARSLSPPRIVSLEPKPGSTLTPNIFNQIAVTFDTAIASLPANPLQLFRPGADGAFGTADDTMVAATPATLDATRKTLTLQTLTNLVPSVYRAQLAAGIQNDAGNARQFPYSWSFSVANLRAQVLAFDPPYEWVREGQLLSNLLVTVTADFPPEFSSGVRFTLAEAGPDRRLGNADDVAILLTAAYTASNRTFHLVPPSPLNSGIYRLAVSGQAVIGRTHQFIFRSQVNRWAAPVSGAWSVATNWSQGEILDYDVVVIDRPESGLITTVNTSPILQRFETRNALQFTGQFFNVAGESLYHGPVTSTEDIILVNGRSKFFSDVSLNGSRLYFDRHRLSLESGSSVTLREQGITQAGLGSSFTVQEGARLDVTVTNQNTQTLGMFKVSDATDAYVENRGVVMKSGPGSWTMGVRMTNFGTIQVREGVLAIKGESSNQGLIEVSPLAHLSVEWPFTNGVAGRILGEGKVTFDTYSAVHRSPYEFGGLTEVTGTQTTVTFNAPVRSSGSWLVKREVTFNGLETALLGPFQIQGGTVFFNSPSETRVPQFELLPDVNLARLRGSGLLNFRQPFTNQSSISIDDSLRVNFEQPVHVTTNFFAASSNVWFAADVFWTGGSLNGIPNLGSNSTLFASTKATNEVRGLGISRNNTTMIVSGPGRIVYGSGQLGSRFENSGLLQIGEGSSFTTASGSPTVFRQNSGTAQVNGLLMASGFRFLGGLLSGNGKINTANTSVNAGQCEITCRVSPGDPFGVLTFEGQAGPRFEAGSELVLDVAGTTPGVDHDQITSSRSFNIVAGSRLVLRPAVSNTLQVGQEITLIQGGRAGAQFTTVEGLDIDATKRFRVIYDANSVKVRVESR